MVDYSGTKDAFSKNTDLEYSRNKERYEFLKWAQTAFDNMRIVPPGVGICHQVNIEYLARVVWTSPSNQIYMDTVVGTDSHTTMINGLGVLGWGVGGIEVEAVMLDCPIYLNIPKVIGVKLKGSLREGMMATDLVLTITQMLRAKGVVGKFVEFYGEGYKTLSLPDRATLANMAPEYGATCGYCPIDAQTLAYLKLTGRSDAQIELVEKYTKEQGLWYDDIRDDAFDEVVELDLSCVEACLAGPKRPQDRVLLKDVPTSFIPTQVVNVAEFGEGSVAIAAITSCTNTSNPYALIAAGLVARKARTLGLQVKPWVKTSFAPGSQVVGEYLTASGLQDDLDALGFNIAAYGCATCIGNSGPLKPEAAAIIDEKNLTVAAVLSGNRNFEGRIHAQVKANYLASPPLVVAYALAGNVTIDVSKDAFGEDRIGNPIYLKDIWPSSDEIRTIIKDILSKEQFTKKYDHVFEGGDAWKAIQAPKSVTYSWDENSTYIKRPPYFDGVNLKPFPVRDIKDAQILAILGDSITTDHISPAGSIKKDGPAGKYLMERGISQADFNSYGARRGNHEIMTRGTFSNIRLQNEMTPKHQGGVSKNIHTGEISNIYDTAKAYTSPLVVFAGKEYGTGSSRDWAAKGTLLLGVKAVIAESFERIHRSNLIGMGVLPLVFENGMTRKSLELQGDEKISILGLESELHSGQTMILEITSKTGQIKEIKIKSCLDTEEEIEQYANQGVLLKVFRTMMS
jgi:aconitate hydratase